MTERAAIVTGASSGIGLAITKALGREGFAVTAASRREEKLRQAIAGLIEEGLQVEAVATDVADEGQIVALVDRHRERFGRLDVLVNNAGVGVGGPIAEHATKSLDLQLEVNLRGTFILTREAVPLLKEAGAQTGKALVVNIASIAGKNGQAWLAAYSASKAGIVALTEATQAELGSEGVTATAICPGFVDTAMTDWIKDQVPAEQMIQPEDVAESVLYLLRLSPKCAIPEIVMKRPGEAF